MNKPVEKRNSIKDKLLNMTFPFIIFIYKFVLKIVLKLHSKQFGVIFLKTYINANLLFPNSTLDENHKLARFVARGFCDKATDITIEEVKQKRVKRLRDELLSDENIKNDIANYFLIDAFYYSFANKLIDDESYIENANKALVTAKSYNESAELISDKDLDSIKKNAKKEIKILVKKTKEINTKKVEEEKSKLIGTIKVTIPEILIISSAISVLLVVGGFLYTTILLYFLGINTSDFFEIYDYVSSSVDVIFPVILFIIVLMFFYFKGASDDLSILILARQSNSEPKSQRYWFKVIAVLCFVAFLFQYYYNEIFLPYYLIPIAIPSFYYITFDIMKLDKYIKNKFTFRSGVLFIFCFLMYLGLDLVNILYDVKSGTYESRYVVSVEKEYEEYSDYKFFMANSKYVFLLNDETQEMAVIPITGIKSMQTKKSQ